MSDRPMHTVPGAFQKLQQLYAEGDAAIQAGDLETGVAKFTEGIAIDDHFRQRYITMYAQRGFALQKLGRLEEAIEDYTKALALGEPPENQAQYYFHRGLALQSLPATGELRKANVERAVADYGASIELYADHPGPYHLRGKLLVNDLEKYAEAIPDLEKTLSIRENADARQLHGFACFNVGRLDDAREDFERVKAASHDPYADYMLAAIAAKAGDADALVLHATQALAGDASYKTYFAEDDDFAEYRSNPAFSALLA